jgi:hypothetical protein
VLQDITTQLNGAEERVMQFLQQQDFTAIAGGISNIAVLKDYDPLKEASASALTNIISILEAHAAALRKEFMVLFEQKDLVQLEHLVGQASARDRAFSQLIAEGQVSPLVDAVVKAFQAEIEALAGKHFHNNISVTEHAQTLLELKKYVSGVSYSAIQNLADKQIVRYIDELSRRTHVDLFELGTHLASLGPLGHLIVSTCPRFAEVAMERTVNTIAQTGITLDHALRELKRLNSSMTDSQITNLRAMGLAFDGFFKSCLRKYFPGYEGNFVVRPKSELVRDIRLKVEEVRRNVTSMDLVEILAGVFVYWSVLSASSSAPTNSSGSGPASQRNVTVIEPHVIQLLAIFRLLELDKARSWADRLTDALKTVGTSLAGLTFDLKVAGHLIQVSSDSILPAFIDNESLLE